MPNDKTVRRFFLLCLIILFNHSVVICQQLTLKVAGDAAAGFQVDIYSNNQLLVTSTEEFSLQLFNNDLSTVANMQQWKGDSWTGNEQRITLKRESYIK